MFEASLFPNWVGTDQVRFVVISDDKLIVTVPPLLSEGKTQTISLVFQRAAAATDAPTG